MATHQISTIEGGITQMAIKGKVSNSDLEILQALSQLSLKFSHVLIDLSELEEGSPKFFQHLEDLSSRTKMKIIATNKNIISECAKIGLPTFPTVKSAALSYAGDETIRLLLSRLRDVPILNSEAYELISYVSQSEASFSQLENMLKKNSGLCSQILRMANSSYFKRSSKVETLQQALVTLGFFNLRQLFIYNFYSSVGMLFRAQQATIDHGRATAVLAEYISRSAGASREEAAKVRMGGLLHDIGRIALAFFFPQQYERVHTMNKIDKKPTYLAELVVFGTEHQSVGSLLASKWNFPDYLCNIIGDHHYLQATQWNPLTLPVFCANNFLHEIDGDPFVPYYQKLEGYFMLKKRELPWKDIKEEFLKYLETQEDVFS